MSQSLADLFAVVTDKKKSKQKPEPEPQENAPLAYPAAESLTDVTPPDDGKIKD